MSRPGDERPTGDSVEAALQRAAAHARSAAAETARAVRALLDALALLRGNVPAEADAVLSRAAIWLDSLAHGLGGEGADAKLTRALAEALDAEIERWEARAIEDPDARAVLRAFLGVRELLWELGVRSSQPAPASSAAKAEPTPRRGRRVERVQVQR